MRRVQGDSDIAGQGQQSKGCYDVAVCIRFCCCNWGIYKEQKSIFIVLGFGKSKPRGRASGKGFLAVSSPQRRTSHERKSMRQRKISEELTPPKTASSTYSLGQSPHSLITSQRPASQCCGTRIKPLAHTLPGDIETIVVVKSQKAQAAS